MASFARGALKPVSLAFSKESGSAAAATAGTRTPLVILHGLFGSKSNWKSLQKQFARQLERDVYALDLRNHGESPHTPFNPGYFYAEMAADVAAFVRAQGIESYDLMGHSMGGKAAALLALVQPERMRRLVMVDIAPVSYRDMGKFVLYANEMARVQQAGVRSRQEADKMLQETVPELSVRQFLLTNLVSSPPSVEYKIRVNLEALKPGVEEARGWPVALPTGESLVPFDQPALFVCGKRDRYIRPEHHPIIRSLFPSPQTEIVDVDAGHWVHAEQPVIFMDEVSRFLTTS